jgi:hypothetical protein
MGDSIVKAIAGNDYNNGASLVSANNGVAHTVNRYVGSPNYDSINERLDGRWIYMDSVGWTAFDVGRGAVPNTQHIHKFGENPDIDSSQEDIWDGGGSYTFTTSAVTYYCSSSSIADTMPIEVQGLDASFNMQTIKVILQGQTKVTLPGTWMRVFRIKNLGASNNAGDIYVYENDTVSNGVPQTASKIRAKVLIGNNQTLMAIYTVPNNKDGLLTSWGGALSKKQAAFSILRLYIRPYGKVFQLKESVVLATTGTNWHTFEYPTPLLIPAKSDILVRADASAADTSVSATFDVVLIER